MGLRPQDAHRGLSSLNESRAQRRRSIVHGKVRLREVATRFWLLTFVGFAIFGVAYWKYSQLQLESRKQLLRARQRAVAEALGPEVPALHARIEMWLAELSRDPLPSPPSERVPWQEVERGPVLYVRVQQEALADTQALRKAVSESLRDGFTSCLLATQRGAATEEKCKQTAQCEPGLRCAPEGICREPDAPFNLSYLGDGVRMLDSSWSDALAETNNEFEVRAMEMALEDDAKHAVPMAAEVARKSRYFLAVIDEPLEQPPTKVAGLYESEQQRLQTEAHWVRVGLWDLPRRRMLAAFRLEADGEFVNMGRGVDPAADDPGLSRARLRQVHNCSLAVQVREALEGRSASESGP